MKIFRLNIRGIFLLSLLGICPLRFSSACTLAITDGTKEAVGNALANTIIAILKAIFATLGDALLKFLLIAAVLLVIVLVTVFAVKTIKKH